MRAAATVLLLCGLAAAASAQPASEPAIERVIVTAPRIHSGVTPGAIAHDFVGSYAVPSILTEQISRWGTEICPAIYGLAPHYTDVTEQRLRTIAMEANAPLKPKGCRPNLTVIFTSLPQVALDKVHAKNVDYLGYHGAMTISHPIQAWYVTATMDTRGGGSVDQDGFFAVDPYTGGVEGVGMASVGGWRARRRERHVQRPALCHRHRGFGQNRSIQSGFGHRLCSDAGIVAHGRLRRLPVDAQHHQSVVAQL